MEGEAGAEEVEDFFAVGGGFAAGGGFAFAFTRGAGVVEGRGLFDFVAVEEALGEVGDEVVPAVFVCIAIVADAMTALAGEGGEWGVALGKRVEEVLAEGWLFDGQVCEPAGDGFKAEKGREGIEDEGDESLAAGAEPLVAAVAEGVAVGAVDGVALEDLLDALGDVVGECRKVVPQRGSAISLEPAAGSRYRWA